MIGWNSWKTIGKDIQHLIIWKYVCNSEAPNSRIDCLIDSKSYLNVYLAHTMFHLLSKNEKALLSHRLAFHKTHIHRNDAHAGIKDYFSDKKAYEYLLRAYISKKRRKEYQGGSKLFQLYLKNTPISGEYPFDVVFMLFNYNWSSYHRSKSLYRYLYTYTLYRRKFQYFKKT